MTDTPTAHAGARQDSTPEQAAPDEAEMYRAGTIAWHTSDEDCGGPDVGISFGLGGAMLYAGEVPHPDGGQRWSIAIYGSPDGRTIVAKMLIQKRPAK